MPVIGRLDGQVEEVIIKPVGRRHAPDEADAPETSSVRRAAPRGETGAARPETRPDESGGERSDDGGLPVWLL
jgi:hypothetical protein